MKNAIKIVKDEINGMAYIISKIENTGVGVKVVYRSYSVRYENGGFETTVNVFGANEAHAAMFLGPKHEVKASAGVFGFKVVQHTINNIVSEKHRFEAVKSLLK